MSSFAWDFVTALEWVMVWLLVDCALVVFWAEYQAWARR